MIAHELAHVKHRDILISSMAATIAAAIMMVARFAMFFGGGRDDDNRGANPIALLATMILGAGGRDADPGGDLAVARVRRRCRRRGDRGIPHGLVERAAEDRGASRARAARRQPGHGAHVHHQAVLRRAA